MADVSDELILALPNITLTAKGMPALLLVIPVSAVLIAVAWRIAVSRMRPHR